jgi:RNase H-like domain found in reverse transcriptase
MEIPSNYLNVIKRFDITSTIRELWRFLRFLNFICKFIPRFAVKTAKFTDLLKENIKRLTWTDKLKENLNLLKNDIKNTKMLAHPDYSQQFILCSDASDVAIGRVLTQTPKNLRFDKEYFSWGLLDLKKTEPIAYFSHILSSTEENYTTLDKEMMSIIFRA